MTQHRGPRVVRRLKEMPVTVPLAAAGLGLAAGYVVIARGVKHRESRGVDRLVRRAIPRKRAGGKPKHALPRPIVEAFDVTGPLGKWYVHGPVAAALATYTRPKSRAAAAAIALSSGGAMALSRALEYFPPHQGPPPGRHEPRTKSFPSNHALETAAVSLTTAYVLAREGRVGRRVAPLAALVPLGVGLSRMALDRHWASDVLAGWLAGAALAAGCAVAYEILPD